MMQASCDPCGKACQISDGAAAVASAARRPGRRRAIVALVLGGLVPGMIVAAFGCGKDAVESVLGSDACRSNLDEIAIAIQAYADEHDGLCPPDLAAVKGYLASPNRLKCPVARRARDCDYVYYAKPGTRLEEIEQPSRTILACDRRGNHRDGRTVLLADISVEFKSYRDFDLLLAQPQNEAFGRHLRGVAEP